MRGVEILHDGHVHGLPAMGRPSEDAGDAEHGSVPDTARVGDLGGGRGWAGTRTRLI
jgi:hypothetical protein